ncbi:DUF6174 domain-containing protein [Nocardioides alpinus]|nr:DUF6174 domain-containing protein [Nocardioides alpinus]PKH43698.1 hypothetical protein CXG46_04405 [Nocardioides alpinus]
MTRALLAALVPITLAAGTSPAVAVADPQPVQPFVPGINEDPDLSAAWQRWEAKDIDDYVITVRLSCFCAPSAGVRTVVRDDSTRRVTRDDRTLSAGRGWSVDELFAMIREESAEADSVTVDYTRRGVPASIAIDRDQMIADEETYYSVTLSRL